MGEVKHTPGPWHVADDEEDDTAIDVKDGRGLYVAEVFRTDYAPGAEVEGQANARLIAAAPEMLAALVKLHTFIDFEMPLEPGQWGFEDPTGMNAAMAEAHEIIRKATGQA